MIQSEFDNLPLDVLIMSPSHPKGIIQISHGMCEHKERYLDFMNFMYQNDFVCIIHDHRGHGKSVYSANDLGYFYQDGDKGIVEDLHQLTVYIRKQYPTLPLYLFGHSMGSLVVRCYLKKYDDLIDGLIVCGSPSINKAAGIGIQLAKYYQRNKGGHFRPPLIQKIAFDSFNKAFDKHTPNSWICSDKEIVKAYNQNPLCHFVFTANGFECLFKLMQNCYSHDEWSLKNENLPIHFIAGENDPCIVNEKKFNEAVSFLRKCGYHDVSSQLFANMQHEILNELEHIKVYQHILNTINSWKQ